MQTFEEWFNAPVISDSPTYTEEELDDLGLMANSDGTYEAKCCVCEKWCDTNCEPHDFDPHYHYCGGSPRCCP